MANLVEIVDIINANLKASQFNTSRFQKGKMYGLAERIPNDDGEVMPCIVDNSGESTPVSLNDNYSFVSYHVCENIKAFSSEKSFGSFSRITEEIKMKFVFLSERSKLNLTKEQLVSGVAAGFTFGLTTAQLNTLSLTAYQVELGDVDLDLETVYKSEFNLKETLVKPNTILFSVPYTLTLEFDKKCFQICNT